MRFLMLIKVREIAERLSTLTALKGLFSGVDSAVLSERRAVAEGLATFTALIRLLPSVNL